jgi:serine/threonine-protein kinase
MPYGMPSTPASIPPSTMMAGGAVAFAPVSRPPKPAPLDRRVALGALAAAAVLLPLLIAVLFLRGGIAGDANAGSTPDNRLGAVQQPPMQQPMSPQQPMVAPLPSAPAAAAVPSSAGVPATPSQPVAAAGNQAPHVPATQPRQPQPQPQPQPASEPPPPAQPADSPGASGGTGTLVAVATGGSCAFSVNGASKGSGTSTKVQLKPGTYSVTCKPSSGATKSRSVSVKSGETAMVSFKL